MRVITRSTDGRISSDTLQPWSDVSVTSAFTGETLASPEAEIPSGVLERHEGGHEILRTVDGMELHLDGEGGLVAYDDAGDVVTGPGIFMVVEIVEQTGP